MATTDRTNNTGATLDDPAMSPRGAGAHQSEETSGTASTPGSVHDSAVATPSPGLAASETQPTGASRPDADNTRVNERDRHGATLTPTDQGNGQTDIKITQQIRQGVMGDKSLSFTAKNVKIITVNGRVTLRGPVKTEEEHQSIVSQARGIAGADNVDDQIEIKK